MKSWYESAYLYVLAYALPWPWSGHVFKTVIVGACQPEQCNMWSLNDLDATRCDLLCVAAAGIHYPSGAASRGALPCSEVPAP